VDPGEGHRGGIDVSATISFVMGDLAHAEADAVVNPTSTGFLIGHAGVNGALLARGGPELAAACERLVDRVGPVVVATGAGSLAARFVLHVVSPIWMDGSRGERAALRRIHELVLHRAVDLGCESVALPAIGCGAHGFPSEVAGAEAVEAVSLAACELPRLRRVTFHFLDLRVLDDYAVHGPGDVTLSRVRALRDDVEAAVRRAGETALADSVAAIRDERTLRAIRECAQHLSSGDREGMRSLGTDAFYVAAARAMLERS
jgi:O-acetyl-ADP-ribose deacetylase (regulator of RNase III)